MIPAGFRKKLGLPAGAVISCDLIDGQIGLEPARAEVALICEIALPVLVSSPGAREMTLGFVKKLHHS